MTLDMLVYSLWQVRSRGVYSLLKPVPSIVIILSYLYFQLPWKTFQHKSKFIIFVRKVNKPFCFNFINWNIGAYFAYLHELYLGIALVMGETGYDHLCRCWYGAVGVWWVSCVDRTITKSVFKGFLYWAHKVCSGKYIKEETRFLIDMFVENGHKRTLIENLVKYYNTKRKKTIVAILPTQRKSGGHLILDLKLRKKLKSKQRHNFHIWQEVTKHPMSKQTEATA